MRFWGVDRKNDRFALQALRANPPGLASEDEARRGVFGAALEQCDELLVATEAVGPAAAPIPLFYAISQAGRAFAAARVKGDEWLPHTHGLSLGNPGSTIGDTILRPRSGRGGSFQLFCQSIGSGTLTKPVTLSAVWAAVGRFRLVEGLGAGMPVATDATLYGDETAGHVALEGPIAADLPGDVEQQTTIMQKRLSEYAPGGEGVRVYQEPWRDQRSSVPRVAVYWEGQDGKRRPPAKVLARRLAGERSGLVVLPMLGSQRDVLHPIAAMFAAWLALSSLARYHPDSWRQALDRDKAPTAVALEEAVDLSLELLPYSLEQLLSA